MATWTIQGEVGKSLDATVRSFADINAETAKVTFRSCDADTLVMTQEIDDFASLINVAELGQEISVFRDGFLFFKGNVTSNPTKLSGGKYTVTTVVSGPWWFAENIPLTFSQTDETGASAIRVAARFVSSPNMKTIIESIITRSVALGVPWTLGLVSTYFQIPDFTFNQMSVAQALSECIRAVPDAVTWVDYSTSPPNINVTRRGVASPFLVQPGVQEVVSFDVNPVVQLKVDQVRVPYASRAPNGAVRWLEQSSGSPTTAKIGVVTVSGPELDTYIPESTLESVQIRTVASTASSNNFIQQYLNATEPTLVSLVAQYGQTWNPQAVPNYVTSLFIPAGETLFAYYSTPTSTKPLEPVYKTTARRLTVNGVVVSGSQNIIVGNSYIPDWLSSMPGNAIRDAVLTYELILRFQWKTSVYGNAFPFVDPIAQFAGSSTGQKENLFSGFGENYDRVNYYIMSRTVDVKLIDSSYGAATTIYKPGDFRFIAPPAGFAANLLGAQNWTPYEGRVELINENPGRIMPSKINIDNSLPAHASMDALISSEEFDLFTDGHAIQLGAPPRIDYKTFMDKVRHTPQDNIVFL